MSQSGGLTPIDIANMALAELGAQTIVGFGDGSRAGRLANQWYMPSLRAMLRAHPWNFARVWLVLPQSAAAPVSLSIAPDPEFNTEILFTSQYQLPPDCVRVHRAAPFQYHYRIVGRMLFTDAPNGLVGDDAFVGAQPGVGLPPLNETLNPNSVGIEYVSTAPDLSDYDPMFLEALALKLASHMCWALTGQAQLLASLQQRCADLTKEAWYADGAEQWDDALYNNVLTDIRGVVGFNAGSTPF